MLKGSCHCGAVSFSLKNPPAWLTDCNCSICRRIGALWAHDEISDIEIFCAAGATGTYVWGDRSLAIHHCLLCGCVTHWENLKTDESTHMAVNCRMSSPDEIGDILVKKFDGADTWRYIE